MTVRDASFDSALEKWRTRWPEWTFAEPFVPVVHRDRALAWFALRDELTDAAWSGSDPRPGEAKLGWWAEELRGWQGGVRRHPLGIVLQREHASWSVLAASLPSLLATRERATTVADAFERVEPFSEGLSRIAAALFGRGEPAPTSSVIASVLAKRAIYDGDAAAPLEYVARGGADAAPHAAARLWAGTLLERWPPPHGGSVPGRMYAAMLRERLKRYATGGAPDRPLPGWRALFTAWNAARR